MVELLLQFAGHLAKSGNAGDAWGQGNGASFISGGPYHVSMAPADSTNEGADNSIQAGAALSISTGRTDQRAPLRTTRRDVD